MTRPINTLFMLMSIDGKITTGDNDTLDTESDYPKIEGIREGLGQYYELEKQTDRVSLNSGKVMAKVGLNHKTINCPDVDFVIIDNKSHLTLEGVRNLVKGTNKLYLVTSNKKHPGFEIKDELEMMYYPEGIDFSDMFRRLKEEFGADRVTIQSGGTLNAVFLREKLIDRVSIVVVPCLIGGKDTNTLVDGESLHSISELSKIKALKLKNSRVLENSYLHLEYDVINETMVD